MDLNLGQFAIVGHSPGVVVFGFGDHPDVPEEHVAVWYGEVDDAGTPRVRTVPKEYVKPLDKPVIFYH